jgi:hypothetical protein
MLKIHVMKHAEHTLGEESTRNSTYMEAAQI